MHATQGAKVPGFGSGGGGASPFTPTRLLIKRKTLQKRAGFIMQARALSSLNIAHIVVLIFWAFFSLQQLEYERASELAALRPMPAFRPGDVLELKLVRYALLLLLSLGRCISACTLQLTDTAHTRRSDRP